jgi:hypothetical protein
LAEKSDLLALGIAIRNNGFLILLRQKSILNLKSRLLLCPGRPTIMLVRNLGMNSFKLCSESSESQLRYQMVIPLLFVDFDGGFALERKFLGQILQFALILRPGLLKRHGTFLYLHILMTVEVLQIMFQALATILCTLQLRSSILKLIISKVQ